MPYFHILLNPPLEYLSSIEMNLIQIVSVIVSLFQEEQG